MAKKNSIKVDGASFSREFVEGFASEAEFLQATADKDYAHIFEGPNREAKLKQVYAVAHPPKEAPAKGAKQ